MDDTPSKTVLEMGRILKTINTKEPEPHMKLHSKLSLTRTLILATLSGTLILFACGESGDVDVNDESANNMSAVEATDACFASCMERPGATDERCAEACAEIGGATCEEGCIERGGDEADCELICAERDAIGSCYEGCMERGGDEETCAETCRERDRLESGNSGDNSAAQAAYEECLEAGGSAEDCREQAAEASATNDSDSNGAAQSAYDDCIEAGGSEEDCRERAAAASEDD